MPVEKCTINGKSGWRWGKSGKCYTGPGAKAKAAKQGRAIKVSQTQSDDLFTNLFKSFKSLFEK
jgi:hypothetical protein